MGARTGRTGHHTLRMTIDDTTLAYLRGERFSNGQRFDLGLSTGPAPRRSERLVNLVRARRVLHEEIAEVVDTLRSGWITTGPKAKRFEQAFGEFLGEPGLHCIAVNSATAGLHLALEAVGIGPGDEVITTTHTFTATAEVVRYLGADVKLVDIDPATLNICPKAVEAAITPRTKAILPKIWRWWAPQRGLDARGLRLGLSGRQRVNHAAAVFACQGRQVHFIRAAEFRHEVAHLAQHGFFVALVAGTAQGREHLVQQQRINVPLHRAHDARVAAGHGLVTNQQFFVELFAGPQADEFQFDVALGFFGRTLVQAIQANHGARQIGNAHRLAH
ncbi:hypothetical protein B566_EDAN019537, partial [Ephemera danica]